LGLEVAVCGRSLFWFTPFYLSAFLLAAVLVDSKSAGEKEEI